VLAPDEWTDGDSFRVRLLDGRLETISCSFQMLGEKGRELGERDKLHPVIEVNVSSVGNDDQVESSLLELY